MNITLPLEQMTIEDKLNAMEQIWDNLCHGKGSLPSPDWHEKVLSEREQLVCKGKSQFISWDKAKSDIRSSVK